MLRPLYKPRPVPNRYVAVFAAVAASQFLDLATFIPAVARVGIGAESNPFARTLYLSAGPLGPAALKAAAIAIMLRTRSRRPAVPGLRRAVGGARDRHRPLRGRLEPAVRGAPLIPGTARPSVSRPAWHRRTGS